MRLSMLLGRLCGLSLLRGGLALRLGNPAVARSRPSRRHFGAATVAAGAAAGADGEAFDFETLPYRSGTGSLKWDKYAGRDIIPLWVADMDFKTCPAIQSALHRYVRDGVYGYTNPTEGATAATARYLESLGMVLSGGEDILFQPGAVQTLNIACRLAPEGSGVMVFTPIYPPFLDAPAQTGRALVTVPLVQAPVPSSPNVPGIEDGSVQWTFDWDHMEAAARAGDVGLIMLCNPHNPVGRVFGEAELRRLGEFAEAHGALICSDEIHCDLILETDGTRHAPIAALDGGRFATRTITVNAASKTFNVPGLGLSYAVITDRALRRRYLQASRGIVTQMPALGYVACEAAYADPRAAAWRAALRAYLRQNRDTVYSEFIQKHPGAVEATPMSATYLAWLDVSALRLRDPVLEFERGGAGLSDGRFFGAAGHVRLNFALPRWRLREGLGRMSAVVEARRAELLSIEGGGAVAQ